MDEPALDVRDLRGRAVRLGIAAAIGLVVTVAVMLGISAASIQPNADPVGGSSVAMLAIAVFVVVTATAARALRRRAA